MSEKMNFTQQDVNNIFDGLSIAADAGREIADTIYSHVNDFQSAAESRRDQTYNGCYTRQPDTIPIPMDCPYGYDDTYMNQGRSMFNNQRSMQQPGYPGFWNPNYGNGGGNYGGTFGGMY